MDVRPKLSSIFNCFFCSQPFTPRHALNKGGKVPLVLNCGHSACDSCITRQISKPGDSLTCQLCKTVSQASDNFIQSKPELEFPLNSLILGQLAYKSQSGWNDNKISFTLSAKTALSPRNVLCHECAERTAEFKCLQCQVPYCAACFKWVHQTAKALKDHTCTDLNCSDPVGIETKCSLHKDEDKQFWCEQCSVAACRKCFISSHNGHNVLSLCDKNMNCLTEVLSAHANVSNVQTRLKATRKKALNSLSRLENTEIKEAEKELKEHFSRLHGLLISRENKLINSLYSPARGSANSLKNMLHQIDLTITDLEKNLEISKSLIQNDLKYLNNASYFDVLETLRLRENTPCFLLVSSSKLDTSKFEYDESLIKSLESHGKLEISNDGPMYRLVTEEDLPLNYPIEPIKLINADSLKKYSTIAFGSESASGSSISPAVSSVSLSSTSFLEEGPIPSNGAQLMNTSRDFGNRNFDELVEGCTVKVILTHAVSPSDFYVRRIGFEKKLKDVDHIFSKLNLKTPILERIKPGDHYMAQFSQDKKWYRCVVTEIVGNLITVFYIDFGNIEKVKRESLRLVTSALMKYDGMAVHCCLNDCIPVLGEWAPQSLSTLLKITESGELSVSVCKRTNGLLYVDMMRLDNMDGVDLKKALIFLGFAQTTDPEFNLTQLIENVSSQRPLPTNKIYEKGFVMRKVILTHCESPNEFYVQDTKDINTLKQLKAGLLDMYSRMSERMIIYQPKIGMIVAAMNSYDNEWRRAKIIAVPDYKKVEVKYLDYGNTEVISFKRLRYLGHKFFKIRIQCSKCRLVDIAPSDNSNKWNDNTLERFAALVQHSSKKGVVHPEVSNAKLSLVVHSHEYNTYNVILYKDQTRTTLCINTALVKENLAVSTGPSSTIPETPLCDKVETTSLQASMLQFKTTIKPDKLRSPFRKSDEIVAPLPAQVNEKLLTELNHQDMHQSMQALPQYDTSSYHTSSTSSLVLPNQLADAASFKPLTAKPTELSSSGNINKTPSSNSPDCIKIPVNIVKVVSPSELYITPVNLVPKLKILKNEMQKFYNSKSNCNKLKNISQGSICVIKREVEGDWCRAVIIKLTETTAEVRLPDFGDLLEVSKDELFPLPDKFLTLRDGVTRCHLGGLKQPLEDRWPMTSTDEIIEFADKHSGNIFITKLGEERANSLPVEVLLKEELAAGALEPTRVTWISLNNNLRMRGLALSDGTIDWDIEDYRYVSTQQQSPNLQMDMFKGIPIKYSKVADTNQFGLLEDISNTEATFGSTLKLNENQDDLRPEDSISRLSLSDSCQTLEDPVLLPPIGSPVPAPIMPKAWLPPLPFNKLDFIANPTNVNNDASLFLQDFQKSVSTLKRISEILDSQCQTSLPMPHDMYWSVDQTCIARYHLDQKWYRGLIQAIRDDNTVSVELVDYGNVEECLVSDLRKMPLATDFPIQGQFCKLTKIKPNTEDGKWTIPVLDRMHSLIVEKHCLVNLSFNAEDQSYYVENVKLPDGSEMLSTIVKEGHAAYDDASLEKAAPIGEVSSEPPLVESTVSSSVMRTEALPEENTTCEVLSLIDIRKSPSVSQNENVGDNTHLTQSWAAECEAFMAATEGEGAQPGQSFTAYHQANTKSEETMDATHVSDSESLYLLEQPCDNPSDLFDMGPRCVPAVAAKDECELSYLPLELPSYLKRFEIEVGALLGGDMVAFQITDSNDMKLNFSRERFHELTEELQTEAPLQPLINFPLPNDVCCAQFSRDDMWYRAIILEVLNDQNAIVKYVDYGNIELLPFDKIREAKESWTMVEVQSLEAKLHNVIVPEVECNWKKIKYELNEVLLDDKLTAVVFDREPMLSVELYKGDKLAYQSLLDDGLLRLLPN